MTEKIPDINHLALAASRTRECSPEEYKALLLDQFALERELREAEKPDLLEALRQSEHYSYAKEALNDWSRAGFVPVGLGSSRYPLALASIHNPPFMLCCLGNLDLLDRKDEKVAVVGSRNADPTSRTTAYQLAKSLASRGITIVSGLALGVDGAAHEGALASGREGATIAVLGSGLRCIYPASHAQLFQAILDQQGLVISQFAPDTKPFPSNFLDRNRVISGLSLGTIVVQAGKRSGALSTARHALEQGREVLVLPGPVTHPGYQGSHQLIRQGATLVTGVHDILEELPQLKNVIDPCTERTERAGDLPLSQREGEVLELLSQFDRLPYDEALRKVAHIENGAVVLLELELKKLLVREPGNFMSVAGGAKET